MHCGIKISIAVWDSTVVILVTDSQVEVNSYNYNTSYMVEAQDQGRPRQLRWIMEGSKAVLFRIIRKEL